MADFSYYQRQFTQIAEAGISRTDALYASTHPMIKAEPSTMDRPVEGEVQRRKAVTDIVRNTEQNYRDAASVSLMQPCFVGLAKWIKESTGYTSLDAYLTAMALKVSRTFANIALQCGLGQISESNIEE